MKSAKKAKYRLKNVLLSDRLLIICHENDINYKNEKAIRQVIKLGSPIKSRFPDKEFLDKLKEFL